MTKQLIDIFNGPYRWIGSAMTIIVKCVRNGMNYHNLLSYELFWLIICEITNIYDATFRRLILVLNTAGINLSSVIDSVAQEHYRTLIGITKRR